LDLAEKFLDRARKEIEFGVQARYELPRAEAEVANRRMDLRIAQLAVLQQANELKRILSRKQNSSLEATEIVPIDRIHIPEKDDLPPLRELVTKALAQRADVAIAKIRNEVAQINAIGTENPLLPMLRGSARTYNRGVAGTPQASSGSAPDLYYVGGSGTALGQIVRRNFPNNEVSLELSILFNNRQAQGDYGVDQLQLRQSQISELRDANQIVVDISNQVSALRQARARYSAATDARTLQEQLLEADQQRFASGSATIDDLVIDQRNLATAQLSEITAMANYAHARVALDQVMGQTLESNGVSLDDAMPGPDGVEPRSSAGTCWITRCAESTSIR